MTHYSIDTRTLQQGDTYVAIRGDRYDGHDFVPQALEKGAAGLILERVPDSLQIPSSIDLLIVDDCELHLAKEARHRLESLKTQVIAITGSVGKTTTKRAVVAVVEQAYPVVTPKGNFNTLLGISLTVLNDLHKPDQKLIVEMGTYGVGNIARLCQYIRPTIAVVTNVGPAHLERMGTMENITRAKGEIVEALPDHGTACLNYDDERVRGMAARTSARVLYYGRDEAADVRPERITATIPLLGEHIIYTALASYSAGLALGMGESVINAGIAQMPQEKGRLNPLAGIGGITLIDDTYNAAPSSTLSALSVLAGHQGRKIAFLGDMLELGSQEESGHIEVVQRALSVTDVLGLVGSRMAKAKATIGAAADQAHWFETSEEAVKHIAEVYQAQNGDCVLVKGSLGIRMERIVKHLLHPSLDPREVLVRQEAKWQS